MRTIISYIKDQDELHIHHKFLCPTCYWLMLPILLMNGPLHCFQQNKINETNHNYYLVQFINAINGGI